ncbi:hypothetical protein [Aliidongia dinghuensis]|uniref:hypothetical protein n=1 Tax=Aliidongia dinghuensis TaxID=1867774 RepID=UPI00166903D1|nr:hypothetical protein [Aliidongia dinghuensis]
MLKRVDVSGLYIKPGHDDEKGARALSPSITIRDGLDLFFRSSHAPIAVYCGCGVSSGLRW